MSSSAGRNRSFRRSSRGFAIASPTLMTRYRIAQSGENWNPKSPENRPRTRRFLQTITQTPPLGRPAQRLGVFFTGDASAATGWKRARRNNRTCYRR
jgi:hypothetical protein